MIYFVACFFIVYFVSRLKKNYNPTGAYLVAVYTLVIICGLILSRVNSEYSYDSFFGGIIFAFFILLYLSPFQKLSFEILPSNSNLFLKRFSLVGYIFSGLLIIGCLLFITKIQEAFAYGLVESRADMYRGELEFSSYTTLEHIGNSIARWLCGLSYPLMIMYFYATAFIPGKRRLKLLLIISTLSATYLGLMSGGRTNLIYWFLYLGFCLSLFWKYNSKENKKAIIRGLLIICSVLILYFIIVTVGRANESHGGETASWLLTYLGQQYSHFCDLVDNVDYHSYTLRRIFPLSSTLFEGRFDLNEYRGMILNRAGYNIGIFYTLLGDFYIDVGFLGMTIYSVCFYLIAKSWMRRKQFRLPSLLIFGLLYQIPLHGVFYYSLWHLECTASIIILLFIVKFLDVE